MTGTVEISTSVKKRPFFFNVTAIFILVYSVLGALFFMTVLFYQLFDRNFLMDWKYKDFNGVTIILYLIMQAVLHGGLVFSAIKLLKHQKSGLYIFILSYTILTFLSFYLYYEFGWINTIIGFIVLLILLIYRKILTWISNCRNNDNKK